MTVEELKREITIQCENAAMIAERLAQYIKSQEEILAQTQKNVEILQVKLQKAEAKNKGFQKSSRRLIGMEYSELRRLALQGEEDTLEILYIQIRDTQRSPKWKNKIINIILKNINVPEWILRDLSVNGTLSNKIAIVTNPKTPEDVLKYLYYYGDSFEINRAIAFNTAIPENIKNEMVYIEAEVNYDKELCWNMAMTDKDLMKLSKKLIGQNAKKSQSSSDIELELINILVHPNVSNETREFIRQNSSKRVQAVSENKELVPIECCKTFWGKFDRNLWTYKICTIEDCLRYTKTQLYAILTYKEKATALINWVESLGFELKE